MFYQLLRANKKKFLTMIFLGLWGFTAAMNPAQAEEVHLGFKDKETWEQWEKITFPRTPETQYTFAEEKETVCGVAEISASGMAIAFPGTLEEYPVLSWEWKINHVLEKGDARKKEGDDYAARIYINFKRDKRLNWWERTRARVFETFYSQDIPGQTLNFIWANQLQKGEIVTSPYTEHARMVALQSGNERAGKWIRQEVNILQWYHRAFEGDPPPVHSIAIMTDSDDTGETITACFRRIVLKTGSIKEEEAR
jgi:hypothetical protein